MNKNSIFNFCCLLFLLSSCSETKSGGTTNPVAVKQQFQELSEKRTEVEKNDSLENFLNYYNENAISMPEYQSTLNGINEIKAFYKEIFQRQTIKTFKRTVDEIIDLDSTIIEIGSFRKEYTGSKADTLLTQNGKYWNVWEVTSDGSMKLKGEAFGFFHPIENPAALLVQSKKIQPAVAEISLDKEIPFELKAYNALMEKGVRNRDGVLRSEFFTNDASFMPFADSTVTGMEKMKPYLIAYSSRGQVTIDSISCYTYHAEYFDDYVLEYAKFRVKWTTSQFTGRTEGKGIRIWKRQEDKSLRLYREIGMHDHLE